MSFLAFLLQFSAAASHPLPQPPDPIQEVIFDSDHYCLPLADSLPFELPSANRRLVDAALVNGKALRWNISFHKAMARQRSGPAYYVFIMRQWVDIYLVYETDPKRKAFVRKFRYFSKYNSCPLPWPPEA